LFGMNSLRIEGGGRREEAILSKWRCKLPLPYVKAHQGVKRGARKGFDTTALFSICHFLHKQVELIWPHEDLRFFVE